jgi:hypothetical protein
MMAAEPVQLVRVRTNYRQVEAEPFASQHLHMIGSSGCFLGSCLHLFSGVAGAGLYASTHIYGEVHEVLTGTNAVSDRFLSSARMRVVHDGAAVPRIEKLARLTEWPAFLENARVCWTPRDDGRNCGHCEKCLRTVLALLLVSGQLPAAFPLTLAQLRENVLAVRVKPTVRILWQEMVAWAAAHGVRNEWSELAAIKTRKRWKERRREFRQELREIFTPA